jgi:hypothetical protein
VGESLAVYSTRRIRVGGDVATKIRKEFLLDPDVLRRAREALGVRTDTEAVERALRSVAIDAELSAAQADFVMSEGEIVDVYGRLGE